MSVKASDQISIYCERLIPYRVFTNAYICIRFIDEIVYNRIEQYGKVFFH